MARHLELTPRGTIFVILTAIRRKLTTEEEAKQMLATLIEVNFHICAKIYHETIKAIEHL